MIIQQQKIAIFVKKPEVHTIKFECKYGRKDILKKLKAVGCV